MGASGLLARHHVEKAPPMEVEVPSRLMSSFSVLGSLFIIITFLSFSFFRKPIHRLVFYACFGNLLANIATIMSIAPIPAEDIVTPLCEFQGVLIQWFLVSDSIWVLCMAINVFLVFYKHCSQQKLRSLEKYYLLVAYIVPAIPAFVYLILDHNGHPIFGSANIWCWVEPNKDWMRIAFFYAPVWFNISATIAFHAAIFYKIYNMRKAANPFLPQLDASDSPGSVDISNVPDDSKSATNGIVVTTNIVLNGDTATELRPNTGDAKTDTIASRGTTRSNDGVSITSYSSTRAITNNTANIAPPKKTIFRPMINTTSHPGISRYGHRATIFSPNAIRKNHASAGITTTPGPTPYRGAFAETASNIKMYRKVAFLMFLSLVVVWVPSSVNRIYQIIVPASESDILNVISAFVLPTQGMWNAIIYFYTSKHECKQAWKQTKLTLFGRWVKTAAAAKDSRSARRAETRNKATPPATAADAAADDTTADDAMKMRDGLAIALQEQTVRQVRPAYMEV